MSPKAAALQSLIEEQDEDRLRKEQSMAVALAEAAAEAQAEYEEYEASEEGEDDEGQTLLTFDEDAPLDEELVAAANLYWKDTDEAEAAARKLTAGGVTLGVVAECTNPLARKNPKW